MKTQKLIILMASLSALALLLVCALDLGSIASAGSPPGEWPQWRGPNRDGISNETNLLKSWPEGGPQVLWRAPAGSGYSSLSIAQGRVYTMFGQNDKELVVCLDAASGKEVWRIESDSEYKNGQGDGPRSTPVVDGDLVFTLGAKGKLHALRAKDGAKVWGHDLAAEFGGKSPTWGISTTPLVEGELLLIDVGGKPNHSLMAFSKRDGKVVWKSQTDEPGYSAPITVMAAGVKQVLFFTGSSLVSVSPTDGKLFWRFPWKTEFFVNAATPVFLPGDKVFISSSYGTGAAVLQITSNGGRVNAQPVWMSKVMKNHFSSSVLKDGYLYGFDDAILKCIDANTGEEKWKARGYQKGQLILADGHLVILGERGNLGLVEATPEAYKEKALVQVLNGKCWSMPSLSDGKLYVRNEKEILCLDVNGKKS